MSETRDHDYLALSRFCGFPDDIGPKAIARMTPKRRDLLSKMMDVCIDDWLLTEAEKAERDYE